MYNDSLQAKMPPAIDVKKRECAFTNSQESQNDCFSSIGYDY